MFVGYGIAGVVDLYKRHSVACTGMKGAGKDMLTANVVARRNLPYASNVSYGFKHIPLDFKDMCIGSKWFNLLHDNVAKYECPFPEYCDIYISDAGIYLPSQYCNELNRSLPDVPTFVAVQRHLNNGKTHYNTQNLNRVWDKIREMCDVYIYSEWCKVLFGKLVIQSIIVYDKAESCQSRVKPCRVTRRGFIPDKEADAHIDIYRDQFYNQHGTVERRFLVYINKSKYDTRHFKKVFGGSTDA